MARKTRMTPAGIKSAARVIGCAPALVDAIFKVESRGFGFDKRGRVKILFEKHKFYRYLPKNQRKTALGQGLASKRWSAKQYADQRGYTARWELLGRAIKLNETAALKSTSWGIGQIMGFNHRLAGYGSVQAMVSDFKKSEDLQAVGFANFIIASGLADECRDLNFRAIARFYNGAGQVDKYSGLIKQAYYRSKFERGGVPEDRRHLAQAMRFGSQSAEVEALQNKLTGLGYPVDIDGDFGRRTHEAVHLFQTRHGLPGDGIVGPKTTAALEQAIPRGENRRTASQIVGKSATTQVGISTGAIGSLAVASEVAKTVTQPETTTAIENLSQIANKVEKIQNAVSPIHRLSEFAAENAAFAIACVCIALGIFAYSNGVKNFRARKWS